jgi:ABC-2 type transport system ATP-binding protein
MSPAIETSGLTRRFGDLVAVDGVDLSIGDGELFSLLGPNGAGKTTTIRMLCGLLRPSSGSASVLGHDVAAETLAVKRSIAVSPQETAISKHLTARENMRLMARLHGLTVAETNARTDDLLGLFGLADRADERVKRFSGGMQRRLSIAMALVSNPRVLFLDEPTLGLDPQSRSGLWEHITHLKDHITIVHTTHYLEEADALADRIGIIDEGRIVALGTAAELKKTIAAEEALVVESTSMNEDGIAALRDAYPDVRVVDGGVEIGDPAASLQSVVDLVRPHGVTVDSTYRRRVTLDDVFLRLTGKELRE